MRKRVKKALIMSISLPFVVVELASSSHESKASSSGVLLIFEIRSIWEE